MKREPGEGEPAKMLSSPFDNLANLQTNNHSHLLDVIDELREQGLSNFLPLPQLIVCGDQSSGKSSVLEAISGVPFPKKDSLCTRFATEVVLRRANTNEAIRASVSILPGADRSESDKQHLRNFGKVLTDLTELPEAIESAKKAMGLGSQGSNAFSTDVLRLEVTGPRMPQLTIVDLPGLIHSENKFQTAQDVELVSKLVQNYMSQNRTIILAVVSAKNDHANQIVLKRAREEDPSGERTLGIITKPDTLYPGSESEKAYLNLAKNLDVPFKLGWHVVRNLDSNETSERRGREFVEQEFFRTSNWRSMGAPYLGSDSLRKKLSSVLFQQITHELPNLMAEIETCRSDCEGDLLRLGHSRKTDMEQRGFLTELNQKANDICRAGCNGVYDDALFRMTANADKTAHDSSRIRSIIQNAGITFASKLKNEGVRWTIAEKSDPAKNRITEKEAVSRVVKLIERSRGRELPGTYNPMLISELFHEYSTPWEAIAREYVYSVWQHAKSFVTLVIQQLADETVCDLLLRLSIYPEMDAVLVAANDALKKLFSEMDRHAMTFNNRFIEKTQEDSREKQRAHIEKTLLRCFAEGRHLTSEHVPWMIEELVKDPEPVLDRSAALDVLEKMVAFYEVAREKFTDNVPLIVVEGFVVQPVLELFQPRKVFSMPASLVQQIAGESPEMEAYREKLTVKVSILRKGEAICNRYAAQVDIQRKESPVAMSPLSAESTVNTDDGEEPIPAAEPDPEPVRDAPAGVIGEVFPTLADPTPKEPAVSIDDVWGSKPKERSAPSVKKEKKKKRVKSSSSPVEVERPSTKRFVFDDPVLEPETEPALEEEPTNSLPDDWGLN